MRHCRSTLLCPSTFYQTYPHTSSHTEFGVGHFVSQLYSSLVILVIPLLGVILNFIDFGWEWHFMLCLFKFSLILNNILIPETIVRLTKIITPSRNFNKLSINFQSCPKPRKINTFEKMHIHKFTTLVLFVKQKYLHWWKFMCHRANKVFNCHNWNQDLLEK